MQTSQRAKLDVDDRPARSGPGLPLLLGVVVTVVVAAAAIVWYVLSH